ncbi:LOW QUALITY PROTEIN: uncharacterized protein LOC142593528 [Pelecanus crispus]|uniref:LOW QUALITY PROTEIN: uncharacterized protein LOC142593528 n=1 Tax=Pelecanus crispus TaxID=36300 RepID=UPI003F5D0684
MNFGLTTKPFYEAAKGTGEILEWTPECCKAFRQLKRDLMSAPALGLPNWEKPFELFVGERQRVALGVLVQKAGSWKRPVGYFSKRLDRASKGQPSCLRAVAATVLLIQEARKLTLGQEITVQVPHAVTTTLEQKGGHWLSPSRMIKYQAVLLERDNVELKVTTTLNPATLILLPGETELEHDCLQTVERVYSSRVDLKDTPLEQAELNLFIDGSSQAIDGVRRAGYAVVIGGKEIQELEAKALPANTSAQKAELVALIRALELAEAKIVNIWTDSTPPPGKTEKGNTPGKYWQIDFSELPRQSVYRHLLVSADTFSRWPEAFPCPTNQVREVVKVLLKETIPHFGIPIGTPSDRGPHFVAKVLQTLAKIFKIKWDLHPPWRLQSSGQVEKMNQTIKRQLNKICQEAQLKWPDALPLALLRARITPRSREKVSPFEI